MKKKINKYYVKDLEDRNRGLKKRLNAMDKAGRANHSGLHYWKRRALEVENDISAIQIIANGFLNSSPKVKAIREANMKMLQDEV